VKRIATLKEIVQRVDKLGLVKCKKCPVLEAEMTEHIGHDYGGEVINPEGNVRNGVNE